MGAAFDLVTFDSVDPDDLAAFWSAALGLVEVEREDGNRWILLAEPNGRRRLGIQRGAHRAGSVHLDLRCEWGEHLAELSRLVELGAVVVRAPREEPYGWIVNLCDPHGNPFDLCAYR